MNGSWWYWTPHTQRASQTPLRISPHGICTPGSERTVLQSGAWVNGSSGAFFLWNITSPFSRVSLSELLHSLEAEPLEPLVRAAAAPERFRMVDELVAKAGA